MSIAMTQLPYPYRRMDAAVEMITERASSPTVIERLVIIESKHACQLCWPHHGQTRVSCFVLGWYLLTYSLIQYSFESSHDRPRKLGLLGIALLEADSPL